MTDKITSKYTGLMPISYQVEQISKNVLGKHGFSCIDLLTRWNEIIGEELAQGVKPEKITYPHRERKNGVLHLRVSAGAFALVVEHQKEIILDKVNTFLGYKAIADIRVRQDLSLILPDLKKTGNSPQLTQEQEELLQKKLSWITDDKLKESLYKIGKAIFLK